MKHGRLWMIAAALLLLLTGCTTRSAAQAPTAAPAPVFDQAAWQAAAERVMAEYAALDEAALNSFDEAQHPELPFYSAAVANPVRNSLYYACYDFDNNGVPELVIAAGDDDWQQPMGIYAYDGEKMVYLCKEHPLGERSYLTFFRDGLFVTHGSGSAFTGACTLWRIAPDGFGTDLTEIMEYEYGDDGSVTYTPVLGHMTPEEFAQGDYLRGFDLPLSYTRFAERLPEG